ncbi:HupE/UreJ family protein, partial [Telluria sp. Tellsp99]
MKWNDNTNIRVRHEGPCPRPSTRLGGAVAALATLAVALPAAAHPGHPDGGFTAGLLHPLTGLDHLCALLAVRTASWSCIRTHRTGISPSACWPS